MTLRIGQTTAGGGGRLLMQSTYLSLLDGRGTYGVGPETIKAQFAPGGGAATDVFTNTGAWDIPAGSLQRAAVMYRGNLVNKMRSCARGWGYYAPLDPFAPSSDPAFRFAVDRFALWATFAVARKDGGPVALGPDPGNDIGLLIQGSTGTAALSSASFVVGGAGNRDGIFFGMGPLGQWLYCARSLATTETVNAGPNNGARVGPWEDFVTVRCDIWRGRGQHAGRLRFSVNGRPMIARSYDVAAEGLALPKRDPVASPNDIQFYPWLVNKSITHDLYLSDMGAQWGPDSDDF